MIPASGTLLRSSSYGGQVRHPLLEGTCQSELCVLYFVIWRYVESINSRLLRKLWATRTGSAPFWRYFKESFVSVKLSNYWGWPLQLSRSTWPFLNRRDLSSPVRRAGGSIIGPLPVKFLKKSRRSWNGFQIAAQAHVRPGRTGATSKEFCQWTPNNCVSFKGTSVEPSGFSLD